MSAGRKRKALVTPSNQKRKPAPMNPGDTSPVEDLIGCPKKRCDRRACDLFSPYPFCFVQATDRCPRDGYTSRWYHLSAGQHFCNECFEYFYRSNKPGYMVYNSWCSLWEKEAGDRVAPGAKMFLVDQYLPLWVRCTIEGCRKWRKLPSNIELHHVKQSIVRCADCSRPEDEVVAMVAMPEWISVVSYTPMLRFSQLAPLLSEYFPDGVSISPTTIQHTERTREEGGGGGGRGGGGGGAGGGLKESRKVEVGHLPPLLLHPLHPFNHPQEGPRACAFTPDVMEPMEVRVFPEFYRVYETQGKWHCPRLEVYCLMRNVILALWFYNCKEYITELRCVQSLCLRGLLRIWCAREIHKVLHFLTARALVNHGFIANMPRPLPFLQSSKKMQVLVIGAGAAGVAAANHLQNYGHTVQILEASNALGGRVRDNFSLGPCVGLGATFVTGICNNPFTLLSQQLGIPLRIIDDDRCDLVNDRGRRSDCLPDMKVERYFNETLDLLASWRRGRNSDVPLEAKLNELSGVVLSQDQPGLPMTEEERELLNFHYQNLEFACGAHLSQISSLHWDHNDSFSQFSGSHAILSGGFQALLGRVAEGLDVTFGAVVTSVECEGGGVRVTDEQGRQWQADKVVITVPLAVLKNSSISFSPPLQEKKKEAIARLGAGLVEKVALRFPTPFWRQSVQSCDFFGHVTSNHDNRGMFGMFYDMSSTSGHRSNTTTDTTDTGNTTTVTGNTTTDTSNTLTDTGSTTDTSNTANTTSTADITDAADTTNTANTTNTITDTTDTTADTTDTANTIKQEDQPAGGVYILVATVSGRALDEYHRMDDSQIVQRCVETLRLMFGSETVPSVLGYLVSRWGSDRHIGMSYSYVAVGSSGADYDIIAESVNDLVYFAGEATNRQHPQTVTGAYLSGIREACNIMDSLKDP